MKKKIAIIGAGMSGLTVASALAAVADVTVFEKARGVGGRMSTRYAAPFYFDHGAQFFTARTAAFKSFLAPFLQSGLVAEWKGKVITFAADGQVTNRIWFEPHYVGVPQMNIICKHLAKHLVLQLNTEVAMLSKQTPAGWVLTDKFGSALGLYDMVISTAPPVQTAALLEPFLPQHAALCNVRLRGCYTLMLGWQKPWHESWIAAKVHYSPVEWIAVNSTKPGRDNQMTSLVVHSSNAWAESHIDNNIDEAGLLLRQEFEKITGVDTATADFFTTHRWRYALVDSNTPSPPYFDSITGLGSTGDWCAQSRIEDVWLAAQALAKDIQRIL